RGRGGRSAERTDYRPKTFRLVDPVVTAVVGRSFARCLIGNLTLHLPAREVNKKHLLRHFFYNCLSDQKSPEKGREWTSHPFPGRSRKCAQLPRPGEEGDRFLRVESSSPL